MTFVSAMSSQGTVSHNGGVVSGDLGTLAGSSSATVTIQVTPMALTNLTNRVSVTRNEADPDLANNTASAVTAVLAPIVNGSFETGNFSGWITNDLSQPFFPMAVATQRNSQGLDSLKNTPTDGAMPPSMVLTAMAGRIRIARIFSFRPRCRFWLSLRAAWTHSGSPRIFLLSVEPTVAACFVETISWSRRQR